MGTNLNRSQKTPSGYNNIPTGRQLSYDKLYLGKIKDNRDVRHMGRLKVWIPELSKAENESDGWILVSYCSPFAGATNIHESGNENTYESTQQAYGFWAVPPDLNAQVLVMFVGGDQAKGYWVGCVYDEQMNFSVPAMASDDGLSPKTEYNRRTPGVGAFQDPTRPIFAPLNTGLKTQGLNFDTVRGLTSSSARRRGDFGTTTAPNSKDLLTHAFKPAKVYGISTPQGHNFVMDDGYENEGTTENSQIRFRTRSGTQIIIDESEGFIYMISKNGKTWLELEDNGTVGNIDVYATTNISLHAEEGNVNIKSGNDINLQAERNLNIKVGNEVKLDSDSTIHINSGGAVKTTSAGYNETLAGGKILETGSEIHMNSSGDPASSATPTKDVVTFAPPIFLNDEWTTGEQYNSGNIVPRVPQHEPWPIHNINRFMPTESRIDVKHNVAPVTAPDETERTVTENEAPTVNASTATSTAPETTPEPATGLGNLTTKESRAYLDALGQRESSQDYTAVNSLGYAGKYQMGTAALEDSGYMKTGTFAAQTGSHQSALNNPDNWTGRNGINSEADWLASETAQEDAMETYTNRNYKSLIRNKVITSNSPANETAGYMAAAHLGGVGGAKTLKQQGIERADAYGSSTAEYFDLGAGSINTYRTNNT